MKKPLVVVVLTALVSLSVVAQGAAAEVASTGKMLVGANGTRLGTVHRVTDDGSAQLIVDGKLVTVPAATLTVVDGKLTTSLSKSDVRKLK